MFPPIADEFDIFSVLKTAGKGADVFLFKDDTRELFLLIDDPIGLMDDTFLVE